MGPRTVVALLGEDMMWRSEDLLTQSYLNSCFGPPVDDTVGMNPPGYQQTLAAAKGVEKAGWDVNIYMPELNQSAA